MSRYCPEKGGPALYLECLECEDRTCKNERRKKMKKTLDYKERCADCVCLAEEDGQWYCDEAQEFCKNIEDGECPEGE